MLLNPWFLKLIDLPTLMLANRLPTGFKKLPCREGDAVFITVYIQFWVMNRPIQRKEDDGDSS